jgi:four helix bundle protein
VATDGGKKEPAKGVDDLKFYQLALKLLRAAYKMAAELPDYEKYNLASQVRRAALSAVLNMAEGYGRYHYLDKLRFFYYARGSLSELRSAFASAHIVGYIDSDQLQWAHDTEAEAQKSLNGYIGYLRRKKQGQEEFGDKLIREDGVVYEVRLTADMPDFLIPLSPDFLIPSFPNHSGEDP